jgi:hypothetical protein
MLPAFEGGSLPPGIHEASLQEVEQRLGWNERRRELLVGLRSVLEELARAGCTRAWLDGSFVTEKEHPGDFDLTWDVEGVDLDALDEVLLDLEAPRQAQKEKYGGDILPNSPRLPFLEFFQQDAVTGEPRGIVELRLEEFR